MTRGSAHDETQVRGGILAGLRVVWPILSGLIGLMIALGLVVGLREHWSIQESVDFAFVSGLTIGYGDLAPKTLLARILAIVIGVCGVPFTAVLAAVAVKALAAASDDGKRRRGPRSPPPPPSSPTRTPPELAAMTRVKTSVPPNTPTPIGPYSHIAMVGEFITIGGTGLQSSTGQLVGPDAYIQTKRIFDCSREIESVGSDLNHVLHVNVFLQRMADSRDEPGVH